MHRIFTIARLTLKAAFRYRLIQVLTVLLLIAVVGLPAIIKHDGTPHGFTQILLTYTLSSITVLLGFATLWLACGTLARDIEECQIQMVVVKPVARWEIWVGKWLGIMLLNAALLSISGAVVYGLMSWRSARLPAEVQERLRAEILIARNSVKEPVDTAAMDAQFEHDLQARLKEGNVAEVDRDLLRKQIRERVKIKFQIRPPGTGRRWTVDFGRLRNSLQGKQLSVRFKFFTSLPVQSGTYLGVWQIGPPEGRRYSVEQPSLAPEAFHEFSVPAQFIDDKGILMLDFLNYNDTALLFPLEDGLEVLYPESSFGLNFVRGLGIVMCWLALLASIGLFAGSFLSFPVAAFVSLAILIVGLSSGTLKQVVDEGGIAGINHDTGLVENPDLLDRVAVPLFRGLLWVVNLVQGFSPLDSLSTGRSVTWGQLGLALAQIVLFLGGIFAAIGIVAFTRRELATAQGNQ